MPLNRNEQIMRRRDEIPKMYRGIYDRAMRGKSRDAAIHAFCLECCGWQIKEVFACANIICPLYPFKPSSRISPVGSNAERNAQKSSNADQLVLNYG